ncbi:MAG: FtsW/RodA/SpoVE family cell cycle protein, partial [Trebonia sp.]
MSGIGIPSRGYGGPRWGTFSPKRKSLLAKGMEQGGLLRSWDWLLILATLALTGIGIVLVWAASAPELRAVGADPHSELKKAILWAGLGVIMMLATASLDYRRYRRWAPVIYCAALLLLLAVLVAGKSGNGAKAWINLPGGFQVEPSEFAKLGIVVSTAAIMSRQSAVGAASTGRPTLKSAGLA